MNLKRELMNAAKVEMIEWSKDDVRDSPKIRLAAFQKVLATQSKVHAHSVP